VALDLSRRYQFGLRRLLDPTLADAFRDIPGVHVWRKRPMITAPYNVGWLVEQLLTGRNIAYTLVPPSDVPLISDEQIKAGLAAAELQEGIWDSFLLPFQREVVYDRLRSDGGHIFAPAGSGKTVMAVVWALCTPGAVVAVTKSRARRQWVNEVKRFAALEPFGLYPTAEYRKRDKWRSLDEYMKWCEAEGQRPFIIMGWEGLRSYLPALLDIAVVSVVFDESHKGRQKKRARYTIEIDEHGQEQFRKEALGNISDLSGRLALHARRELNTTASPIVNRLADLWAQLKLIEPDAWGETSRRFELRYCNGRIGQFGGIEYEPPGVSNAQELESRMSFTVSRVPYAVLAEQLPPKRRMVTRIAVADQTKGESMSRADRSEYKRDIKELGASVRQGTANRWAKERLTEMFRADAAERKKGFIRDRVPELITAGKGKVLIFTGRKRACEALEKTVRGAKRDLQVWMAHGDTNEREFAEIHKAYMAHPGPCVLIGTYQAWGESLNLQDTDHMLIAMLPITPGEVEQTEGRGARLGQSRPFTIEYLIAEHTIDERLASILLDKLPAVEQVTGATAGVVDMAATLKGTDDLDGLLDTMLADIDNWG
jgi:hypothetical protein